MSTERPPRVRGMRDILPEDHELFSFLKKIVRRRARQFHYQRITTPVVEYAALFERGVGEHTDAVEKEMYKFTDRGGREIALRPEGTAGVMRAYLDNGMQQRPQPVKFFYQDPFYRYDRPQAGRYREFWQIGAEVIGSDSPAVDAEGISFAWKIMADAGIKGIQLQLNSIGCQDKKCRPKYLQELGDYLHDKEKYLSEDDKQRLAVNPLRVLDSKNEDTQIVLAKAPKPLDHLCPACQDHWQRLRSYLDAMEIPYEINQTLVRGLDYYSRTVFEFYLPSAGYSIGGGGRYDYLAKMIDNKDVPAFGFALGVDRMMLAMTEQGITVENKFTVHVFLVQLGEVARLTGFKMLDRLHDMGVHAVANFSDSSLRNQLAAADRYGAPYAIILGDMEVKKKQAIIRDMKAGTQEVLPLDEVEKRIGDLIPESVRKKSRVDFYAVTQEAD